MLKSARIGGASRRRKQTQTTYERHPRPSNWFIWLIVALAVVTVVAVLGAVLAHNYFYPAGMPYYMYPGFGWWFFPFGLFFLIFLFFIFRVVFWGWGGGWGWRRRYWYGYGDAHEILRQRYARGEITKDQFEQMSRDLEHHQ